MKRNKSDSFVVFGTAVAAIVSPAVNTNALGVKDFLKFFSWSNFKNFFDCIYSFIAERVGKRVNVSANIREYTPSTREKILVFYSNFIDPMNANASLEKAKKCLSKSDFRELIRKIAKDCKDSQIIHIWDKNGDLGLPTFDGDIKEEFILGDFTLVSVERKVWQEIRRNGSYHGWVVESQIDPGKILFIHPKGDLNGLGSGESRFFIPYYSPKTEEEKNEQQLYEKGKIAEAEQNTPELDLDLLRKHVPGIDESLSKKNSRQKMESRISKTVVQEDTHDAT